MISGAEVRGLKEFRRELRKSTDLLPKEVGAANAEAAEVVLSAARKNASALGGVAAKVIRSNGLRPSKAAAAVKVILGSESVPYAIGAEYGSIRYKQFKEWRGNQWTPDQGSVGYFLHPAIRDTREEFIETYADIIMRLTRKAFPDG